MASSKPEGPLESKNSAAMAPPAANPATVKPSANNAPQAIFLAFQRFVRGEGEPGTIPSREARGSPRRKF
jgi:hypothetical protein